MNNKIIISILSLALFACGGGSGDGPGGSATTTTTDSTDASTPEAKKTDPIAIGLPVQARMHLSADKLNPRGWDINGQTISVTANLGDKYGRPVADGLRVNFTSEGGYIEEFCTTTGGSCSVTWTATNRRPGDGSSADALYPNEQIGVVTITAHTEGEADFEDANHNGLFDADESFVSYGEPFVDYNNNGTKEDGEWLLADTNGDGKHSVADPDIFLGSACSDGAKSSGHCPYNMHVSDSIRVVMSGDEVELKIFTNTTFTDGTEVLKFSKGERTITSLTKNTQYYVVLQDQNGNMPVNATKLEVTAPKGYALSGLTGDVRNSPVSYVGTTPIYGQVYPLAIVDTPEVDDANLAVIIKVTTALDTYNIEITVPLI